ncbi:hypothetical protein GH714_041058 [Hevea brasiliensis]|uniref:Uncharacterized protein n=1 Tax=Hevea brasiliensis TaxID=3981 RepID=A0A6A6NAE0_HEVBR|nr:hypothetical protein GH714_041058 [Hevea brasiliensis]
MDFQFHYNPSQANKHLSRDPCLEFEAVDDRDALYAELRRQVLLLIADDNDDFAETTCSDFLRACKPGSDKLNGSFLAKLQPGSYVDWCEWDRRNTDSVPRWLVNLWRKGNGTGVFIPQIVKSRQCGHGRNRMNKGRRRAYKQVAL